MAIAFTATDNENGSGVEKTEYSLDNGATWSVYENPFTLSSEGTTELRYFSTDKSENQEVARIQMVTIDKTAPEARVAFNSVTQKLDIIGTDSLSNVSVVILEKPELTLSNKKMKKIRDWFSRWHERHRRNLPDMLATLTDDAGHVTSLSFEKTRDRNGFLFVRLLAIGYNGNETILRDVDAQYKWKIDKKGKYQILATHLKNTGSRLESHYNAKKNETWIMEKSQDLRDDNRDDESDWRPVKKKLPGMVIPGMTTEKGKIKIMY